MRVRGIAKNIILQAICLFMVVVVILPILLTLFASLKSGADMVNTSSLSLPPIERITFSNFERVLSDRNLYVGLRNTVVILAISLVFNVAFGTVTAYIIERFNFRFKGFVVSLFFLGMLIPTFVTEISRFKIISGLGLYNTLAAPIVIYVASDLMQLYIYRQFISKISVSLDESAILDGCSYWRTLREDHLPTAQAGDGDGVHHQVDHDHQRHVHSLSVHAQDDAQDADDLPDELRQRPAGQLADPRGGNHRDHASDRPAVYLLPEVHPCRSRGRSRERIGMWAGGEVQKTAQMIGGRPGSILAVLQSQALR